MLAEKYPEEVKKILAKYPPERKQSAVMPLLHLAQQELGYVDRHAMQEIADLAASPRPTWRRSSDSTPSTTTPRQGKLRLQVCTDISCALRGADEFLAKLCERLGIEPGGTTPDGLITVEAVMCLAACDKAPMFQVQGPDGIEYHENMTVEKTLEFIEARARR